MPVKACSRSEIDPSVPSIIGTRVAFDAVRWYGKLGYFSINNMRRHHSSPEDMQAAADQGCQICIILCEHWAQMDKSEKDRISALGICNPATDARVHPNASQTRNAALVA